MSPELLTVAEVAASGWAIAAAQEPDGAIPWSVGGHTDVWNHVEATMALLVAGRMAEAERAWAWVRETQRHDGSWPRKVVRGSVEDASGETNMAAYVAVGVWHHWLVRHDLGFVVAHWPAVRRALDLVCRLQLPFGGIAWSQEWDDDGPARTNQEALLAGSASTHQALRAGLSLAELLGDSQPEWELTAGRLGHALRHHRELFLDKSTFSMDWYYPVLGGAVRGEAGRRLLEARWESFVVPGLGARCVDSHPWVTGAETCELALALDAVGDRERARAVFAAARRLRQPDGSYWTGYVYTDGVPWPAEHTTFTTAAVLLAHDALAAVTLGGGVFRGTGLVPDPEPLALGCGCASADALAGRA
ncbi:MAG TPA: prenyltransferase [Nocardioides sp.]|uniref:prenyltransferase n=1 Tax=Nocardioides sp. TaxID=35761 RepID=UPI002E33F4FC|nr:prenyltransferase [Nocardioides sp.]HEX3929333.1 prenyltransferase [Nocardioides sp.]